MVFVKQSWRSCNTVSVLVLLMDETLWSLMTEGKDIMCNVFARSTSLLPPQLLAADAQLTSPPPPQLCLILHYYSYEWTPASFL